MALTQQEQLQHLINQIKLPEEIKPFFDTGRLTQVTVSRVAKTWTFEVALNQILPANVFMQFSQYLHTSFTNIAQTKIILTTPVHIVDEALVNQYWHMALTNSILNHATVQQLTSNTALKTISDNHYGIAVGAESLFVALNDQALASIVGAYQRFGFPKMALTPNQDTALAQQIEDSVAQHHAKAQEDLQKAIKASEQTKSKSSSEGVALTLGRKIAADSEITRLETIDSEEHRVVVEGYIFASEIRELRSGRKLMTIKITDYSSAIAAKKFSNNETDEAVFDGLKTGMWVRMSGNIQEDTYARELVLNIYDLQVIDHDSRQETYTEDVKRIELHVHSTMSTMDAVTNYAAVAQLAKSWGQEALAVVDTANVQGFPEAVAAGAKNDLKMIYGMEANLVEDGEPIGFNLTPVELLDKETIYVAFDLETTGLSAVTDKIIELSAVKMQLGNVIEKFSEYINPGFPLSDFTTKLTSITDTMVAHADTEENIITRFRKWIGDAVLIGHNVTFDIGFMNAAYARYNQTVIKNPVIDTLPFTRWLYPDYKSYRLGTLAKRFNINLEQAHRAIFDAETTGHIAWRLIKEVNTRYELTRHNQLNDYMTDGDAWKHGRPVHATLLVQNAVGLKNLYKLVSRSNIDFFARVPRIPRSILNQYREGLIIGTGDTSGDVIMTLIEKGREEALKKAKYYDYIEIQPTANYAPMIESELVANETKLHDILKEMVSIGETLDKPVVVTGDVKYTNPEDKIYRDILIATQPGNPQNRTALPELYFRTTQALLTDFSFMGNDVAKEIVIDNTHIVADMLEAITPLKSGSYPPNIPSAGDELTSRTLATAKKWYGDPLPSVIQSRIDQELQAIIGNGFAPHYMISQRLVEKSNKDGYLVGSRGSVGSSFVATMSGITEVNPFAPHYRSAHGDYFELADPKIYESGYDLPDKADPNHPGEMLIGDGQNIPFETFMGFKGDKVPDIDLNFSGDYQPIAHNYMKVLFGEHNVYRAGTIATVAEKTAFGYVKGYERDHEKQYRGAEVERLAQGVTGVKRTTGQHPGGILIVPREYEVYDFTPVQYPADDQKSLWQTTHMDYHAIHDNLLKMDILGHDDPTMVRTLKDMSGIDPQSIPANDPGVLSLFTSPKALGVTEDQIFSKTGTLGLPEFGTSFVRGMLEETQPHTYSELLQISGLSHGTDVWLGNANELIENGTATIGTVIGTRDKIMTDLINWGFPAADAFNVMEKVRKGKGITDAYQAQLREAKIPEWYIQSMLKIKYMFPRAHAAAYVLMALRIAYFKVYFPTIYYATYFSVRADQFDIVAMSRGKNATKEAMKKIRTLGNDATVGDKNLLTVLEMANEALERGITFSMVDLYKSEASEWVIDGETLIPPFSAVPSLGDNVAKQIIVARQDKPFLSKEDLKKRGKVSQTVIEYLSRNSVLDGMPDENQLSLFDF
ncbi:MULTISPECIES: PolC-type DNA polymerase III [Leuconostoc]|uniref:DNA polymerase III PolC-type n=1 Tax=Leuconostoc kimchii TaxID=136609 RepID=A0ABX5SJ53_9LACO|nr:MULTISPECIES: PolC-type DNA polymerase III [Leuconostoc]AEJ30301.1 DNA-directed DNA polymerase III, alpha chain PolC-type [Leuconostoc sp. C2]QBR47371.1 PolC-type DNA polymerase III [Leuconostoc kimchii]